MVACNDEDLVAEQCNVRIRLRALGTAWGSLGDRL